ncbi:uncharacterized protein N0V89_002139 [Didymosphaeria variabile]|uniref:Acetyl-CoA synthetase-like protein n=1 Tax=Didymosphaeria variabile TaxID=1932322 RepID=A0A9W9CEE3_9PLEO|nr:uncharacterized protein N0V89_002139 [Didymosphaeria variabile]KAJ4357563.1 hypothetical protein N0V89_002139 [Didymosphaeria variabile]
MSGNNAGVRNLRAMFENQNAASSSPEPRGRSPAGSGSDDVNRPTSKVRASFVSVEPHASGAAKDLGTTKGVSVNTPQAHRRESFSVSGESNDVAELKQAIGEEKEERKKSIAVDEAIPEQAVETRESSRAPPPVREAAGEMTNLGSIMKGSNFPEPEVEAVQAEQSTDEAPTVQPGEAQAAPVVEEKPAETQAPDIQAENPDKIVTGVQEEASLKPADPTDEAAVAGGEALPPPAEVLSHPTTAETAPQTPKITENKAKANETPRTNGRASTRKPAAISTAKSPARPVRGSSTARSPLPRSPLPKTPTAPKATPTATGSKSTTPAKIQPKAAAPKETTKPVAPKFASRAPAKTSAATAGTTASAATKAKPPVAETKKTTTKAASSAPPAKIGTTTSTGGFVKPKPRSPTRPVRLPSHLTAPTASSAAKHGEEAAEQKPTRKPSTASRPAPKAAAPAAKKPPSRASLAPSTAPAKRPSSRASTTAGAGDGFLARMMRPTTASASKTHDKPESPPRQRTVAKASTKPKAPEGLATKTKKKVEEVAAKAKDAVTNGNHEEKQEKHEETSQIAESTATEPAADNSTELESAPVVDPKDTVVGAEEPVSDLAAAEEAVQTETPVMDSEAPKVQEEALYIDAASPSTTISANQAKSLIRQLIAGFKKAGLKPGDAVLIHSFNSIYYPIIVLGIIGAGCIYTGTNPSYTPAELEHAIRTSSAKFLLSEPELLPSLRAAAKQLQLPISRIRILDSTSGRPDRITGEFASWRELLSHGEEDWVSFDDESTSRNTTAMLCFSSGTTGLPKAAQISHHNLIAQHTIGFEHSPRPYRIKRLVFLPMFHVSTAPMVHTSPLRAGHVQYIMRRWDISSVLSHIPGFSITDLVIVPPMVTALVAHPMPPSQKLAALDSLKCVIAGAAPLDKEMQARCQALMPPGIFTQIWAMTETTCLASAFPYGEPDDTGSVGRFLPNLDIKLLDDAGADVTAYGVRGELAVRGPTVIRGYIGVPRERDFDAEGYFRTGDIVWGDERTGKWYVVDRKKELIKVRGFQVAPAEIEGVLLQHPHILDAAVVGVPSPEVGSEMPRAYVVRKGGGEGLDEREVEAWVEERLAKYKRLEGGVRFVEVGEIPKTASGKIKKREMRDMIKREMGAKL